MVDWWWAVIGAAIPAIAVQHAVKRKNIPKLHCSSENNNPNNSSESPNPNNPFVCEKVCTSKRMLNKVGGFSKDRSAEACVTICGISAADACIDACARTVCAIDHHVPNWNDICLRRCQNQCLKLSSGASH